MVRFWLEGQATKHGMIAAIRAMAIYTMTKAAGARPIEIRLKRVSLLRGLWRHQPTPGTRAQHRLAAQLLQHIQQPALQEVVLCMAHGQLVRLNLLELGLHVADLPAINIAPLSHTRPCGHHASAWHRGGVQDYRQDNSRRQDRLPDLGAPQTREKSALLDLH